MVAYRSDTYPSKWFVEYATDADLVTRECFIAVPKIVSKIKFTLESELQAGTQVHTSPDHAGKSWPKSNREWSSPLIFMILAH